MAKVANNLTWEQAFDFPTWTITQAISFTSNYRNLPLDSWKQECLRDGFEDCHRYEVEHHPYFTMVYRAIQIGELEHHLVSSYSHVEPAVFLHWRAKKLSWGAMPPECEAYLKALIARRGTSPSVPSGDEASVHGNRLQNAVQREQLLAAALWCLYNKPKECLDGERFSAVGVVRQIILHWDTFWPGEVFNRNEAHTANLLSRCFKTGKVTEAQERK